MCSQGSRTVLLGLEVMPQVGYKWRPDSTDTKVFGLIFSHEDVRNWVITGKCLRPAVWRALLCKMLHTWHTCPSKVNEDIPVHWVKHVFKCFAGSLPAHIAESQVLGSFWCFFHCHGFTPARNSAPYSNLLTLPWRDAGGNQKSRSEKNHGLR